MKQVLKFRPAQCMPSIRRLTTVTQHDDRLELSDEKWKKSLQFHTLWLRDHCRCSQCYHVKTNQRLFDVTKLSDPNVRHIKYAKVMGDILTIDWGDGHRTNYDLEWLQSHKFNKKPAKKLELWDKATVKPEVFQYENYMKCDISLRTFVSAILRKGFSILEGVPVTVQDTRKAIERLAPVMKTFYGEMWEFSDNMEFSDTAYTSEGIGSHTDTTYMLQSAGIQVLHCLKHNGEGGENVLVDGFNCAEQLKKETWQGYKMLSSLYTSGEYIDSERHYKCNLPIFVHANDSELVRIRYNIYDRSPLTSVPPSLIPEYYAHLIHLSKIVRKPENEYWLKLNPGTVLFMDNWRLLHGRSEYTGSRIMTGCYIDRSDYESKARMLKLLP